MMRRTRTVIRDPDASDRVGALRRAGPSGPPVPTSDTGKGATTMHRRHFLMSATALALLPSFGPRYRLDRLLRIGTYAEIHLATDLRDGRPVVLKRALPGDEYRECLRNEADTLQRLQDLSQVPRLLDESEASVVLEHLPGRDLLTRVYRSGPFDVPTVASLGRTICGFLHDLHSRGLVWCGLTAESLILQPGGKLRFVGFHAAQRVGDEVPHQRLRVYADGYLTAEQIIGRPEPRSDLFALASTLYRLATGSEAEGGLTACRIGERLGRMGEQDRGFFALIARNLPEDVQERSPSARAFATELRC